MLFMDDLFDFGCGCYIHHLLLVGKVKDDNLIASTNAPVMSIDAIMQHN